MKWTGVVLMLVEHYFRYVVGELPVVVYLLGRLVFPLFVFALAFGIRAKPWVDFPALLRRMLVWACVAQVGLALVGPEFFRLNVIFCFALGVGVAWAVSCARSVLTFGAVLAVAAAVGWWCEFGLWGVAFVASTVMLMRAARPGWPIVGLVLASYAGLAVPNGTVFALAALPVAWAIDRVGFGAPRLRGAFYWIYAAQFPVFAALAAVSR